MRSKLRRERVGWVVAVGGENATQAMPTFPISSSSHFLPSSSSIFFISGGAPRTSTSSSHLLTPTTKTIVIFLNPHQHHHHHHHHNNSINKLFLSNSSKTLTYYSSNFRFSVTSSNNSTSDFDLPPEEDDDNNKQEEEEDPGVSDSETPQSVSSDNGVDIEIEIEKIGNNSRRIRSRISIDATLETIWGLLTDYEGLSDFIPGLSVSKLLQKGDKFARIFQIGQQNLAFGVNFNAKGIIDCYEKDLETLPFGRRRDIDFKMVEGDFQTFQGKWSIEEIYGTDRPDVDQISGGEECYTTTATVTLSYIVDVKPKLWLPVGLVEGRLCREVSLNLLCIQEEAQKTVKHTLPTC